MCLTTTTSSKQFSRLLILRIIYRTNKQLFSLQDRSHTLAHAHPYNNIMLHTESIVVLF